MYPCIRVPVGEPHQLLASDPLLPANELSPSSVEGFSCFFPDRLLHRLVDDRCEPSPESRTAEWAAHAFLEDLPLALEAEEVVTRGDYRLDAELEADRAVIVVVS